MEQEEKIKEKYDQSLKFAIWRYLGNKFKTEGIYKSGKRQGENWKLYKLIFENGKYERNVSCFTPLNGDNTLQVEDMEQGKDYNIGYIEKPYTIQEGESAGKTVLTKTALFIGIPREGETAETFKMKQGINKTQEKLDNYNSTKGNAHLLKDTSFDFVEIYKDSVPMKSWNKSHFIVGFMLTTKVELDLIDGLSKMFEEKFKQK